VLGAGEFANGGRGGGGAVTAAEPEIPCAFAAMGIATAMATSKVNHCRIFKPALTKPLR
jgi:hypothetical protein